jgi:hypothetical protein
MKPNYMAINKCFTGGNLVVFTFFVLFSLLLKESSFICVLSVARKFALVCLL